MKKHQQCAMRVCRMCNVHCGVWDLVSTVDAYVCKRTMRYNILCGIMHHGARDTVDPKGIMFVHCCVASQGKALLMHQANCS